MKNKNPFLLLIVSFILTCVICNYGYQINNRLIEYLGAVPFLGTCIGLCVWLLIRNR